MAMCTLHFNRKTHVAEGSRPDVDLEEDCSICFDALGCHILEDLIRGTTTPETYGLTQLNCGHVFHTKCIQRWYNSDNEITRLKCPLCKRRSVVSRIGANVSSDKVLRHIEKWAGKHVTGCAFNDCAANI